MPFVFHVHELFNGNVTGAATITMMRLLLIQSFLFCPRAPALADVSDGNIERTVITGVSFVVNI